MFYVANTVKYIYKKITTKDICWKPVFEGKITIIYSSSSVLSETKYVPPLKNLDSCIQWLKKDFQCVLLLIWWSPFTRKLVSKKTCDELYSNDRTTVMTSCSSVWTYIEKWYHYSSWTLVSKYFVLKLSTSLLSLWLRKSIERWLSETTSVNPSYQHHRSTQFGVYGNKKCYLWDDSTLSDSFSKIICSDCRWIKRVKE